MTDKERYQRTFSLLQASPKKLMEVKTMNRDNTVVKLVPVRRLMSLCAAALLLAAMASVAYAADIGGIRRTIRLWIHGDPTDAVLEVRDGGYSLTYQDDKGEEKDIGGGGVAIENDGSERPLTEDEILEYLDSPDVEYLEDGTVWVYFRGQKVEITDKFEDGVCYVMVKDGEDIRYLTVRYQAGFSVSPNGYIEG